ncbi:MAG: hypothetical protein LUQ59_03245 [Methanothrix sp.]|nr:hypothetical protein [Methanothrix sp.]
MNIERFLPSARPKFSQYSFEVIKPGSLWRLREEQSSRLLPIARKTRTDKKKLDVVE